MANCQFTSTGSGWGPPSPLSPGCRINLNLRAPAGTTIEVDCSTGTLLQVVGKIAPSFPSPIPAGSTVFKSNGADWDHKDGVSSPIKPTVIHTGGSTSTLKAPSGTRLLVKYNSTDDVLEYIAFR